MSSRRRIVALLAGVLLAGAAPSCAREAVQPAGVRVTGRLVDGETGEPVSRRTFWIHGFDDDVKAQESLDAAEESTFALALPTSNVRLRVADRSGTYELWEESFTAEGALDVEVRLVPTHWIRLHGTVLWRDGSSLRPLSEGDGSVRKAVVSLGPHGLDPDEAGSYSVKVSREFHPVLTINTSLAVTPHEVDLRGSTEDDHALDFILED